MIDAGDLDRRIEIHRASEARDNAGDVVKTWALAFKLWAHREDSRGREFTGASQVIRDSDTIFTVRNSTEAREIAPESHRVQFDGAMFEIVGISEGKERRDTILLLCNSRPDRSGARAREVVSG